MARIVDPSRIKNIVFIFVDIETDGPLPGINSMLNFGAVACDESGKKIAEYEDNLKPLPGMTQDPETMQWWSTQPPEVWEAITSNPKDPTESMNCFVTWLRTLPGNRIFVAHPTFFDFGWIRWYLHCLVGREVFDGDDPVFSRPPLDIESYAMATFGCHPCKSNRDYWPKAWTKGHEHVHTGLEDARGYAQAFFEIKNANGQLIRDNLGDSLLSEPRKSK